MSINKNKYNMIYIKKRPSTRCITLEKKINRRYSSNKGFKTERKKYIDCQDIKRNFNFRNSYFPLNNNLSNNFRNESIRKQNYSLNKLDLSNDKERQYDDKERQYDDKERQYVDIFNSERDKVLPDEEDYV